MSMEELGTLVARKRGSMGIRAAAAEIGISPATLSRAERGQIPDLRTLQLICIWLGEDPARFLGSADRRIEKDEIALQIAFKKNKAVSQDTSRSLAKLIELASEQFISDIEAEGH